MFHNLSCSIIGGGDYTFSPYGLIVIEQAQHARLGMILGSFDNNTKFGKLELTSFLNTILSYEFNDDLEEPIKEWREKKRDINIGVGCLLTPGKKSRNICFFRL